MEDIRAKESEVKDLKRKIENIKQKTEMAHFCNAEKVTNLASPEYEFPKGLESGNNMKTYQTWMTTLPSLA